VSSATQRVPGYEIVPPLPTPRTSARARIAEQVANVRLRPVAPADVTVDGQARDRPWRRRGSRSRTSTPTSARIVPIRDPETGEAEYQGQGEIKVLVLSGNEVYWESGVSFEDSKWHAFERAEPT
jgi:hypothetical protein